MEEQDTIKLLRECDSGIKMGIASIDDVLDYVSNRTFYQYLSECKNEHLLLEKEIQQQLDEFHDKGKEPNPIAKSMSWMKTNVKLVMNESDKTIADLITDGCNMGIKSLHKYLNQYKMANEKAKSVTKNLIKIEEQLAEKLHQFL